ncbi:hypothetical protein UA45_06705 [Morganella morganii]|uniref:Uncharacterized protein n=1 Tax=Morganella morganii TaxID=582 RepID=A0A0D8L906_MORMO|nr:hypothetical protein UA45_06705 [Morganella morganii]
MKIIFHILIIIIVTLLISYFIPASVFSRYVSVCGDGEDAMNNYYLLLLMLRIGSALLISLTGYFLLRRLFLR